jgi:hypothetical protein
MATYDDSDTGSVPALDYVCSTSAEYKQLTAPSRQVAGRSMTVKELRDGYDHRPVAIPSSRPMRDVRD